MLCLKVLIGFVATAYLTLFLVIIQFLLDRTPGSSLNPVDHGIITVVQTKLRFNTSKDWGPVLQHGVLIFSDQQLVTGIAILSGGFSQLKSGIAMCYWQIIVELAWFSSITHLTTLIILRQYFRKSPVVRWWRVVLMLTLAVIQVAALVPMGHGYWPFLLARQTGTPAICLFPGSSWNRNPVWESQYVYWKVLPFDFVISLVYLIISYTTRIIKLSQRSSTITRRWLRTFPENKLKAALEVFHNQSQTRRPKIFWVVLYRSTLISFTFFLAMADVYESVFWEVCLIFQWWHNDRIRKLFTPFVP